MPDHVNLIAVPQSEDGLRGLLGDTRRRCTQLGSMRNQ